MRHITIRDINNNVFQACVPKVSRYQICVMYYKKSGFTTKSWVYAINDAGHVLCGDGSILDNEEAIYNVENTYYQAAIDDLVEEGLLIDGE